MEQTQEARSTDAETAAVFREMRLETGEQRDKVLAQNSVAGQTQQVRYVIRLSNSSQPAPLAR